MAPKFIRKLVLCLFACTLVLQTSFATAQAPAGSTAMGARKRLNYIVLAGLGGAVLGLSTLSFYGRPQEKLSNIAIGAAFGIIAGTIMTTYQAASDPKDFYGDGKDRSKAEIWALETTQQRIQHEWPGQFAPTFNIFSF